MRHHLFAILAILMLLMAMSCSKPVHQQAASSEPVGDQARACLKRGESYSIKGDNDKAIAEFTEATHLDPTFARPYSERGSLYDRMGKHDLAIADFTQVIKLGDEDRGYFIRGLSHALHGQHDQAIADFTEAIRVNPNNTTAYSERGKSYRMKGKHDQAIADFTQAITVSGAQPPQPFWAYHGRGLAYADKGEHDKAIADFTQAIRLMPYPQEPYRDRGLSYVAKGEHDKAIADFTQAIRLGPMDAKAYIGRGKSYARQGKLDKAIQDYTEAIRHDPNGTEAFVNRADAYRALGDKAKAAHDERMAQELKLPQAQAPEGTQQDRSPEFERTMTALMLLLLNQHAEVQKELGLTDVQIKKARDVTEEMGKKYRDVFAKIGDMYPSERRQKMEELTKANIEESTKAIASLLTPDQEKRLRQLARQQTGVRAFSLPHVQNALKLSDEQKDKIKTIVEDFDRELSISSLQKMETIRQESVQKATAILTDEQKTTWKDLVGEPFHFEMPQWRASGGKR
jgi:tetratricopeptide (TPR) repeat protein